MKNITLAMSLIFIIGCGNSLDQVTKPINTSDQSQAVGKSLVLTFKEVADLLQVSLKGETFSVYTNWVEGPFGTARKTSTLEVAFYDAQAEQVTLPDGVFLDFYPTMPMMGHGPEDSGVFTFDKKSGFYTNSTIRFNMSGFWKMALIFVQDGENLGTLSWDITI